MISISKARPSSGPHRASSAGVAGNVLLAVATVGAGPDAATLQQRIQELAAHFAFPVSRARETEREAFRRLANRWRQQTAFSSSTTAMAMHPDYQAIIGMGPAALPMILEALSEGRGHWFWALKAISGVDPVPPQDRGAIPRMKKAWLDWGRAKGLLAP